MKPTCRYIILLMIACMGCKDGGTPVPRRTAFPRIEVYDPAYTRVDSLPATLYVNSRAHNDVEKREDGAYWVTVRYPEYRAEMFVTLTPVTEATLQQVVANRTERIDLNVANTPTMVDSDINADNYNYSIVYAPSMHTTPLQFLAYKTDAPRWVVSGSVYFEGAGASVSLDSISPVYQALKRDLQYTFSHLTDL